LPDSQDELDVRSRVALMLERWDLPIEFISDLVGHQSPISYPKGSVLFLSGSPCDIFFLVVGGVVRLYASQPDGSEITFMLAGSGDLLGFANSKDGDRRIHCFDASALTECSLVLFTRRRLVQLLSNQPPRAVRKLIEAINCEWTKALQWQVNFFGASFSRRFELVLQWLAEKFGLKTGNGVVIDLKLSHRTLGEVIGCTRPVVRKLFAHMIAAGAIELTQTGKILLCEPLGSHEHLERDLLNRPLKT
jgi:CRP/FNR family transcriptional regulator, cyclic AMP receptor protein